MGEGAMTTRAWQETTWDGAPAQGAPDPKLTVAQASVTIDGTIQGEGTDRWLMTYAADGTARFVGLTHVRGTVDGRSGTVVLQHEGRFDGAGLQTSFTVVPGSGTGELGGLAGSGTLSYTGPEEGTRYRFDPQHG